METAVSVGPDEDVLFHDQMTLVRGGVVSGPPVEPEDSVGAGNIVEPDKVVLFHDPVTLGRADVPGMPVCPNPVEIEE